MIEAEDPARELLVRYCLLVTCSVRLFTCHATTHAGVRLRAAPYQCVVTCSTPDKYPPCMARRLGERRWALD